MHCNFHSHTIVYHKVRIYSLSFVHHEGTLTVSDLLIIKLKPTVSDLLIIKLQLTVSDLYIMNLQNKCLRCKIVFKLHICLQRLRNLNELKLKFYVFYTFLTFMNMWMKLDFIFIHLHSSNYAWMLKSVQNTALTCSIGVDNIIVVCGVELHRLGVHHNLSRIWKYSRWNSIVSGFVSGFTTTSLNSKG